MWFNRLSNVGGGLIHFGRIGHYRPLCSPGSWDAPARLDNSAYLTPLEDQGRNPWCAAYTGCQLLQSSYWRAHGCKVQFDEGSMYQAAKAVDGIEGDGTSLEAIISVMGKTDFTGKGIVIPRVAGVHSLSSSADITWAIHRYGLVMLGLDITDGWTSTRWNGMIGGGAKDIGGHAVLCSGYDLKEQTVTGPNWWGTRWGRGGFWSMTMGQLEEQFVSGYAVEIEWEQK